MKENYSYFLEKCSALVRKLIAGEGTARERLSQCETQIYATLLCPVPKDLESTRESILKRVHKKPSVQIQDKVMITSFRNTVSSMRNSTASKIIADIYSLYDEIRWRQNR